MEGLWSADSDRSQEVFHFQNRRHRGCHSLCSLFRRSPIGAGGDGIAAATCAASQSPGPLALTRTGDTALLFRKRLCRHRKYNRLVPRLARYTVNAAIVLSLLLCVATAALWLRSFHT